VSWRCLYPKRCGSDGKSCHHIECDWSPENQAKREHLRALALRAKNKRRNSAEPA
jgi:hypothetical protein